MNGVMRACVGVLSGLAFFGAVLGGAGSCAAVEAPGVLQTSSAALASQLQGGPAARVPRPNRLLGVQAKTSPWSPDGAVGAAKPLSQLPSGTLRIAALSGNIPGVPIGPSPQRGYLDRSDVSTQVFSIYLSAGRTFSLSLTGDAGTDFDLQVYAPGSTDVDSDDPIEWANSVTYPDELSFNAQQAGTYFVCVSAYRGAGNYALTWATAAPPAWRIRQAASTSVVWGSNAEVVAQYQQAGLNVSGKALNLERRIDGGAWEAAGSQVTAADGTARFAVRQIQRTSYRVSTSYNGSLVQGDELLVTSQPLLSLHTPSSAVKGAKFALNGELRPRHTAGARNVRILCYRNGILKKTVYATNHDYRTKSGEVLTRFTATLSLSPAGIWALQAQVPASPTFDTATAPANNVAVNKTTATARDDNVWVTYAKSSKVSGYLRNRKGKPLKGLRVRLQQSFDGDEWSYVKTVKTDKRGRMVASVRPKESRYYRFSYAGSTSNAPSSSRKTWVNSCYIVYQNYGDYTNGYFTNPFYLTKGKHQISVSATYGADRVYIMKSSLSGKQYLSSSALPPAETRTYHPKMAKSRFYVVGWEGLKDPENNYVRFVIW